MRTFTIGSLSHRSIGISSEDTDFCAECRYSRNEYKRRRYTSDWHWHGSKRHVIGGSIVAAVFKTDDSFLVPPLDFAGPRNPCGGPCDSPLTRSFLLGRESLQPMLQMLDPTTNVAVTRVFCAAATLPISARADANPSTPVKPYVRRPLSYSYAPRPVGHAAHTKEAAGFPVASFELAIYFCIYPGPQREDGVVKVFWSVY